MSSLEVLVTIGIAVIAATPGVLAFIGQRGKTNVDVARQYEEMASKQLGQIDKLRERLDAMESEIDTLHCELDARDRVLAEWQAGIGLLTNQIIADRKTPIWAPQSTIPLPRRKTSS